VTNVERKDFSGRFSRDLPLLVEGYELLFRQLNTSHKLDEFDMIDEQVVKIFLYAALISLFVSRNLLDLINERADKGLVISTEGWAATSGRTPNSFSKNSVSVLSNVSQSLRIAVIIKQTKVILEIDT